MFIDFPAIISRWLSCVRWHVLLLARLRDHLRGLPDAEGAVWQRVIYYILGILSSMVNQEA